MKDLVCPICRKEYSEKPQKCTCGFESIEYSYIYENDRLHEEFKKKELFSIYKFTKKVLFGEIDYPESKADYMDIGDRIYVQELLENRGLAYISSAGINTDKRIHAAPGLLACRSATRSLILGTDSASRDFLEESSVKILFIDKNFKQFDDGYFIPYSLPRYIYASGENKYFSSENNVLFNKDKTRLISYAMDRPEKEYTVPESVKVLGRYSFFMPSKLDVLRLPRGIRIEEDALYYNSECNPMVEYY